MSRYIIQATWDDAPHLTQEQKDELWESIPPYQREARSKGLPMIGSGAIYPISDADIEIDDFELPIHWGRAYAMDVGWTATAALWGAYDKANDIIYFYSEYKRGEAEPPVHAQAIASRGGWMSGVIDPTARNRAKSDGIRLMQQYRNMGLDVMPANNAVEAGLFEVYTRMTTGRLKIFKSLRGLFSEKRIYRRNEKGHIVKKFDHLLDCCRYWVMSAIPRCISPGEIEEQQEFEYQSYGMGGRKRCAHTGY